MKVVILTNNGSEYGKRLIDALVKRGLSIETVVVINQPLSYHVKLFGYVRKRVGLVEALFFSVREVLRSIWKRLSEKPLSYGQFPVSVQFADGTNTPNTELILRTIQPDLLILAQTGIVRKNILVIPTVGTWNAHPGILPHYRGIDCYKWAIWNEEYDKIGATLHWVNAGVDTGNIIEGRRFDFKRGVTFSQLEEVLYQECVTLITENLLRIREGAVPEGIPQSKGDGKQYYKMSLRKEWIAERKYAAFLQKNPAG